MTESTLHARLSGDVERLVEESARHLATRYPGERDDPQPVHTVYLSAADARPGVLAEWCEKACEIARERRAVLVDLADEESVTKAIELLSIRDVRFDFEDGYRKRGRDAADARAVGQVLRELGIPGGIRIPGLTPEDWRRSVSLLETVAAEAGRGFTFTIPKFRALEQVDAAVKLCEGFESVHGIALRFELQIESPQAIIAADGTATVARAIHRARGLCTGLHYGTYDYSAACGIAAPFQSLDHPVADHAKAVMQVAAAQTGVWVCDGSTQITPQGEGIDDALRLHFGLVERSLQRGYYQGWDMHPGYLVTRWLANVVFYRAALAVATPRLHAYIERTSDFDEPASAESLARVVLRGLDAGVWSLAETGFDNRDVLVDVVRRKER